MFPRSIEAISNAPVAVVRAPIDGRLLRSPVRSGDLIRVGQQLGMIANESVDGKFLLELKNSRAELLSAIKSLDNQILRLRSQIGHIQALADASRDNLVEQLKSKLRENTIYVQSLEVRNDIMQTDARRQRVLVSKHVFSDARSTTAAQNAEIARLELERQREGLTQLRLQIESAEKGLISDADGSLSSLRLRKTELEEKLNVALSDRTAKVEELAEVEKSEVSETRRTALLSKADLTSPVDGRVWQVSMNDSEFVQEGDTLLEVVNCAARVVTATVSERTFNRLDIGQKVDFVAESDDVRHKGVIVQAIGPASRVDAVRYAIRPAATDRKEFRIVVQLLDNNDGSPDSCTIGRTGKIFFDPAYPEALNQIASLFEGWWGPDPHPVEYSALPIRPQGRHGT